MKIKKYYIIPYLILFLLITSKFSSAQRLNARDSVLKLSMIEAHYGFLLPGGDLSERFGTTLNYGLGFMRKTKSNFLWGADLSFFAGNNVKESYVLDRLRTPSGKIISKDGSFADVRIFQRGFTSYAKVGKLIPIFNSNKNSGLMITAGVGFIQHKIQIEVLDNTVPALSNEYKKGYDRLTNGISFQEFIGYQYIHSRFLYNFYVGFDFSQSFTQNRRDWDFYEQRKLDEKRKEYLSGIKLGIIFPLYRRMPKEYYFK